MQLYDLLSLNDFNFEKKITQSHSQNTNFSLLRNRNISQSKNTDFALKKKKENEQ